MFLFLFYCIWNRISMHMMSASIILQNAFLQSHLIRYCCYKGYIVLEGVEGWNSSFCFKWENEKRWIWNFALLQHPIWNVSLHVKQNEFCTKSRKLYITIEIKLLKKIYFSKIADKGTYIWYTNRPECLWNQINTSLF